MSYILDALKKSQEQRADQAPLLPNETAQLLNANVPHKSPSSAIFWVALALGLLCAMLLVLLVFPKKETLFEEPSVLLGTSPLMDSVSTTLVNESVQFDSNVDRNQASDDALWAESAVIRSPRVAVLNEQGELLVPDHASSQPMSVSSELVLEPVATETQVAVAKPKVEVRSLPPLTSLRKVPLLAITSHIYSSVPEKRSVTMNNRVWREGEQINQDVILQEITSSGILLSVEGWPLNVNRQQGWQPIPTGN